VNLVLPAHTCPLQLRPWPWVSWGCGGRSLLVTMHQDPKKAEGAVSTVVTAFSLKELGRNEPLDMSPQPPP